MGSHLHPLNSDKGCSFPAGLHISSIIYFSTSGFVLFCLFVLMLLVCNSFPVVVVAGGG